MKVNRIKANSNTKKLPIIWKKSLLRRICAFIRAGLPVLFGYLLGFWEEIKNASWKDQTLTGLDDCESPTIRQSSKSVKIRSSSWPFLIRRKSILANITEKKSSPENHFCTGCQAWYHRAIWKMKIKGMFFFYKSPESISYSNGEKWVFCSKKRHLCAAYRNFFEVIRNWLSKPRINAEIAFIVFRVPLK